MKLIGERYGRLVIIGKTSKGYLCQCDCGRVADISYSNLGKCTFSCGCLRKELAGKLSYKHGKSDTRLHVIWRGIQDRCKNSKNKQYKNYGGRGIHFCDEWLDFEAFYGWAMANGYSDNLSIDRIDVNGNYEPGNCRWVSAEIQANNKRSNRQITFNGQTMTLMQWSHAVNIDRKTISDRLDKFNWTVERALTERPQYGRRRNKTTSSYA